ncbi:MAG: DUF1376 domain-containing protein [Neisseria sp.]|nr:DUF1376 domain-containing protein [Neisseria sp.]
MHYYTKNIGDYRTDTAHLTLLEHGVYGWLIDTYYAQESPLPSDERMLFRLSLARTDEEKQAVRDVLSEFFILGETGWIHARCDREIADYHAKLNRNRENGKKGGRPNQNPNETQTKPKNNRLGFESENENHPNTEDLPESRKNNGGQTDGTVPKFDAAATNSVNQGEITQTKPKQNPKITQSVNSGLSNQNPNETQTKPQPITNNQKPILTPSTPPACAREESEIFAMNPDWLPDESLSASLHRAGLPELGDEVCQTALVEFRGYWQTRPQDCFTAAVWTHKFLQALMADKARGRYRPPIRDKSDGHLGRTGRVPPKTDFAAVDYGTGGKL